MRTGDEEARRQAVERAMSTRDRPHRLPDCECTVTRDAEVDRCPKHEQEFQETHQRWAAERRATHPTNEETK